MKPSTIQSLIRRQAFGISLLEEAARTIKANIKVAKRSCKELCINPKDMQAITNMYKSLDKAQKYLRSMRSAQKELKLELRKAYSLEQYDRYMLKVMLG